MTNDTTFCPGGLAVIAAVEAWLEGTLSTERAGRLRACVGEAGPWRDAYRRMLREWSTTEVLVPRLDVERTISVAASERELEHAELIELLPLPHLGPEAHREGRLTARGTLWRVVGADGAEAVPSELDVSHGTGRLTWVDPVLGTLDTPLREVDPEPLRAAHDAFISVSRLADGLEHPRARAVALTVARDLACGSLRDGLATAFDAFVHAKLDNNDEQGWVVSALETQLALDRLAHRLCDRELDAQLLAADKALAPLGEALMLLGGRHYTELVNGHAVDESAWWGFRARLDARVPEAWLWLVLKEEEW